MFVIKLNRPRNSRPSSYIPSNFSIFGYYHDINSVREQLRRDTKDQYEWVVIGAGPGGIACIGKLLDAGISAADIAWIDPQFNVGDVALRGPT